MRKSILSKKITSILGGVGLALAANHANALGVDQVNFGVFTGTTVSDSSFAGKKSWADQGAGGFGWVHTGASFARLQVGNAAQISSGALYDITITMSAAAVSGMDNPAFSVWTSGTSDFNLYATSIGLHVFSPVRGPSDGGASDTPALASIGIVDFIGYANSGMSFTNGDGDSVTSGRVDVSPFVNAALSSWSVGADFATLNLKGLKSGYYLMAAGGSCYDGVCGSGTNFNMQVSGSPVPVPGAVWLFGSAMTSLVGLNQRKRKA